MVWFFSNSCGTRRATWKAREETEEEDKVLNDLCIPSSWERPQWEVSWLRPTLKGSVGPRRTRLSDHALLALLVPESAAPTRRWRTKPRQTSTHWCCEEASELKVSANLDRRLRAAA
eukprot:2995972-Pyramimonas_sp.AAC.1